MTELRPEPPLRVGNDVVDLAEIDRLDRHRRRRARFLARILAPEERDLFEASVSDEDRETFLWALWAAKETAFKVHSKLIGRRPVFRHRSYVSDLSFTDGDFGTRSVDGRVRGPDLDVTLTGWASESFVHVAGAGSLGTPAPNELRLELGVERLHGEELLAGSDRVLEGLRAAFSAAEWDGVRGTRSARVRILARRRIEAHLRLMAGASDVAREPTVEIRVAPGDPGRSPPEVWLDGSPASDVDLSLSHHGGCVAWALLLPTQNPGR